MGRFVRPFGVLADLGAPPRVITRAFDAYVTRTVTSAWPALVGIAIVLGFVVAAPVPIAITDTALVGEVVLLAAAGALFVRRERRRRQLRWLLEHAEVQPARVIAIRDLAPDGLRAHFLVELEVGGDGGGGGRRVALRCRDLRIAKLDLGASEPVLWHASRPDAIVPLSLL